MTTAQLQGYRDDVYDPYDVTPSYMAEDMDAAMSYRLPLLQRLLLMLVWGGLFAAVITDVGTAGFAGWIALIVMVIIAHADNGLIVLLIMAFCPVIAITWYPIFKIVFAMAAFRALLDTRVTTMFRAVAQRYTAMAIVFTLVAFASVVIAPDKVLGLTGANRYLTALMFLILVFAFTDRLGAGVVFCKAFVIVAALALLVSVLCNLRQDQLHLTRQGQLYALYTDITYPELDVQDTGGRRWMPYTLGANEWGAQLLFPLGAAIGLIGATRGGTGRGFWLVAAGMIMVGILGTYSRSSFLSAVILIGVVLIRMRSRGMAPALLLVIGGVVLVSVMPFVAFRILSIREGISVSGGTGRFELWAAALRMWLTSPLWGHGMGSMLASHGKVAHNTYLQLLAEQGLAGFIPYVWLLAAGLRCAHRTAQLAKEAGERRLWWLSEGIFAGLVGLAVNINAITLPDCRYLWMACAISIALWSQVKHRLGQPPLDDAEELPALAEG